MSEFYTYCQVWGNNILYRGYKDGLQVLEKVPFKPTLYIQSDNKNSEWKSLYGGTPLEPVEFDSIKEAKDFVERYKDVDGIEVHGFQRWNYQFINKKFPSEFDYDISSVNIEVIDIEVVGSEEGGFPDIQSAQVPIVLISLYSTKSGKTLVLGTKKYIKDADDDFEYLIFDNEKEMLKHFVLHTQTSRPDIWTGWNTSQFDIPYIINRLMLLFDESVVKKLSPFGVIKEKILNIRGREVQTYDIFGIVDLDYLELYKKFGTYSAKESYALGFIAQEELGETKVELSGISFYDSYTNHFQTFVKYSAKDSILIKKFESKMKLIELAFSMAYLYRCNLSDIYKTVAPWEVFIFNYLSKKNIAVPPRKNAAHGDVVGAWVKEPKPGMYGWTMSFDFSSLYPSIIRQWNISPEKFRPQEFEVTVKDFMSPESYNRNPIGKLSSSCKNLTIPAIERAMELKHTIAANGTMYSKNGQGFLAELMQYCMEGRKVAKKEKLSLEVLYESTKDESFLPKIAALENKQMALKIAANSAYGAIANDGFHYYDYRMAEAITLTGQLSDIHLAERMNARFNSLLKTDGVDYVIYGDTDSIYLNCQPFVDLYVKDKTRDQIVDFLDKFADKVCQPVINQSVDAIFDSMNCFDKVMGSKREAIASRVLFRAKKNYAMYVHDSEGVKYDPPKLKVTGIEIVR